MTQVTAQMSVSLDGFYAGPRDPRDPKDMAGAKRRVVTPRDLAAVEHAPAHHVGAAAANVSSMMPRPGRRRGDRAHPDAGRRNAGRDPHPLHPERLFHAGARRPRGGGDDL
jgi:hypothetical protein